MNDKRDHLVQDLFFIAVSIGVAVYIVQSGDIEVFVTSLGGAQYVGSFVAGLFFTSVFTALPAAALITALAHHYALLPIVLIGAVGSTVGDYILFLFLRDRVTADAEYLLRGSRGQRFLHIIRRRHFYRFFPLIGAVLLLSPLPDEPALAFLGLSAISTRSLLMLSFITHALGIALLVLALHP